jgi:hypothetical protein
MNQVHQILSWKRGKRRKSTYFPSGGLFVSDRVYVSESWAI